MIEHHRRIAARRPHLGDATIARHPAGHNHPRGASAPSGIAANAAGDARSDRGHLNARHRPGRAHHRVDPTAHRRRVAAATAGNARRAAGGTR